MRSTYAELGLDAGTDPAAVGAAVRRIAIVARIIDALARSGAWPAKDATAGLLRRARAVVSDRDAGGGCIASVRVRLIVAAANRTEEIVTELRLRGAHPELTRSRAAARRERVAILSGSAGQFQRTITQQTSPQRLLGLSGRRGLRRAVAATAPYCRKRTEQRSRSDAQTNASRKPDRIHVTSLDEERRSLVLDAR
jgi:hypothetical protein